MENEEKNKAENINNDNEKLLLSDVSNLLCVKGKRPETCSRYIQQKHGCNYCKNFKHNN